MYSVIQKFFKTKKHKFQTSKQNLFKAQIQKFREKNLKPTDLKKNYKIIFPAPLKFF